MWNKVTAVVSLVTLLATVVAMYVRLESKVSNINNSVAEIADIKKWVASIEKFQSSKLYPDICVVKNIGYHKAHGHDTGEWCPDRYFISKFDIDGLDPSIAYSPQEKDSHNFPIIGTVTCCRALPPPVAKTD